MTDDGRLACVDSVRPQFHLHNNAARAAPSGLSTRGAQVVSNLSCADSWRGFHPPARKNPPRGGTLRMRRLSAAAAVFAAGALALSACSTPSKDGSGTETTGAGDGEAMSAVSIGWNQGFYEYNSATVTGNATANNNVLYFMNSGFNYYDADLNLVKDESFGTYEKVSDDPLTVTYTVNDDVVWSDGTPVTAADLLLTWGAQSGKYNNVEEQYDEEGNVTNQEEVDAGVYFNNTSASVALIQEFPEISADGKSITFVYTKPFGDWEINLAIGVPAHVVAMHALEMDDAEAATQALVDAFKNNDFAKLAPVAKFWNTGFQFGDALPEDTSLFLSSGPYLMVDYVKDQYVTLEKNPSYTGDRVPSIDQVTFRYNEDPMAQIQALANGEVNLISPQATADVLAAVEGLGEGFEFLSTVEGTYEHVDLAQNNGGPFDAATYGGDAEKAKLVRQAFLHLVPRNEIVATPIDVRVLFGKSNVRRQNEFTIISDTANATGLFNLIDASSDDWGSLLSDTSVYDATIFGWQSTSTAVTESDANYRSTGLNNFYGYNNPAVDALYDELQVSTDPAEQQAILSKVEKALVDDAFGLTLFQFPSVSAWSTNLTGVDPIAIAPTILWNFWEWEIAPVEG